MNSTDEECCVVRYGGICEIYYFKRDPTTGILMNDYSVKVGEQGDP